MTHVRLVSVVCLMTAVISLVISCVAAPGAPTANQEPVAVSADGQPIFALSEAELLSVFSNVQVRHVGGYPPVFETLCAGGYYSTGGDWLQEGRFWVSNEELCARVEGQSGATLCRRFGSSPDGAVYEISGSRGTVRTPAKQDLAPLANEQCQRP